MRHQAHEIIRTWAFYTIVRSLYHTGNIPWKDIMISGFVLAKPGEKISKSKSNGGLSPIELIETHSADAIRYWAAGAKLGTDTFFSEEDLRLSLIHIFPCLPPSYAIVSSAFHKLPYLPE